jgi:hypothetical protein
MQTSVAMTGRIVNLMQTQNHISCDFMLDMLAHKIFLQTKHSLAIVEIQYNGFESNKGVELSWKVGCVC